MKALVVAPQPFFSPRGTPFSVYYRTLVASELGVKVDFITYGEGQDVDIPGMRIVRIPRLPFFRDIKVGPSVPKLFLDVFMVVWTIGLLLKNHYDIVHAHEEAVFFCRFLKPLFGFKLIYDMHSSLPQQLTNFQFTRSEALIGLFQKLEAACLKTADAVITICPDLADYVTGFLSDGKKHTLIENSIFDPVRIVSKAPGSNPCLKMAHMDQKRIDASPNQRFVVYAGTLEPYQGIDILINAFSRVKVKEPEAMLIIAGGSQSQVAYYAQIAKRAGIENDSIFTGRVPQRIAKHYTRLASVLVSPRREGTNTPLKIYEQLASGIPLVATRIFSHTQVLDDDVAFLVKPEPEDMARGILAALKSDMECRRIAANAMRRYREKYSRPVYVGKMKNLLERLA